MVDQPQTLDVIAVGAHPDDVEIACGGTLAKLARQGYRIGIVDLTDGEPTPMSPGPEVRLAEAQRAAEVLGVCTRIQLGLSNRRLFDSFEARVALAIELRRYRPRLVLGFGEKTPMASPDHWQAMQITDAAIFYSRLTKWDEYFQGLPVHTVSTHLYFTLAFHSLEPPPGAGHLVAEIGDTLETKLAAVRCYQTQFPPAKAHVLERVRAMALQQGAAAGYTAGELFASPRTLGTRDLMHFLFGLAPGDEPRKEDVR
ncbi:MAG TPA: PIG-L family deacetylase [Pirellulales bacterium]|jgi:LmbE family N-acetylglucosaminyl deacetylase|nr:PIG-L family deacetylase [Pirellulales bacterium]